MTRTHKLLLGVGLLCLSVVLIVQQSHWISFEFRMCPKAEYERGCEQKVKP